MRQFKFARASGVIPLAVLCVSRLVDAFAKEEEEEEHEKKKSGDSGELETALSLSLSLLQRIHRTSFGFARMEQRRCARVRVCVSTNNAREAETHRETRICAKERMKISLKAKRTILSSRF